MNMKALRLQYLVFLLILMTVPGRSQTSSHAFVNHLQGEWRMRGTVMKKAVEYTAEGTWVLQDQFLAFHMKDVAVPPAYEATLFIGMDSSKNQYVAHWLDSFGGTGARVVGTGPLSDDLIEIIYPYAEGRFRNRFRYDAGSDTWALVIESEHAKGKWSLFAEYTVTRKK